MIEGTVSSHLYVMRNSLNLDPVAVETVPSIV
jgi:hypothetical protein